MVVYVNFRKDIFMFEAAMASEASTNVLLQKPLCRSFLIVRCCTEVILPGILTWPLHWPAGYLQISCSVVEITNNDDIPSLVAEVALRMTGHQQLFRDQRKGKWCDTLLLARARILSGQVRARQNSAKIRALAKSRVSHHFPFLWTRENVWRQRRGGLRMRVWAEFFHINLIKMVFRDVLF